MKLNLTKRQKFTLITGAVTGVLVPLLSALIQRSGNEPATPDGQPTIQVNPNIQANPRIEAHPVFNNSNTSQMPASKASVELKATRGSLSKVDGKQPPQLVAHYNITKYSAPVTRIEKQTIIERPVVFAPSKSDREVVAPNKDAAPEEDCGCEAESAAYTESESQSQSQSQYLVTSYDEDDVTDSLAISISGSDNTIKIVEVDGAGDSGVVAISGSNKEVVIHLNKGTEAVLNLSGSDNTVSIAERLRTQVHIASMSGSNNQMVST